MREKNAQNAKNFLRMLLRKRICLAFFRKLRFLLIFRLKVDSIYFLSCAKKINNFFALVIRLHEQKKFAFGLAWVLKTQK